MDDDKQRIAELVREIQSGNNDAFNELYKLTSSRAYFVALQITKNEEDAQDILQDCCIKAIEKINSLDKPESFVSWFHQMIANKSKDYLKKKKPTLFEGGEEKTAQPVNGKLVKIRIPIPENYSENDTFEISYRYSDVGREPIIPVVKDGYLEFCTGHFSTFEVYVASKLSVSKLPDNTDVIYKGSLDLSGIELTYINDNGETEIIDYIYNSCI